MHAVQHGYSILCLDAENAYFHAEEDEEVCCWLPREWNNVELAWLKETLCARLRLKPAEPMGPGPQYLLSSDEKKRQKSDEHEPRRGEEDRLAYHRCAGIVRHLLKYRPDIAVAVHEVSKTLASPGDADFRRLRRLGRYLLGTQKLGIMQRHSNDPEHLDAYTHADWSGDSIYKKSTFGWNTQERVSNVERIREGSELSNVIERRESEYFAAVTTTATPPTTSGILGECQKSSD